MSDDSGYRTRTPMLILLMLMTMLALETADVECAPAAVAAAAGNLKLNVCADVCAGPSPHWRIGTPENKHNPF
jgi:hypothetical protein